MSIEQLLAWAEANPLAAAGLGIAVLAALGVALSFGLGAGRVLLRLALQAVSGYRPLVLWRRPDTTAERLAQLRRTVMATWEGALEMGEGNYLSHVYTPMVVGLIDVASAAEALLASSRGQLDPDSAATTDAQRLGKALERYINDVDTQRRQLDWDRKR